MKVLSFGSMNLDFVYKVPHIVMRGETLSGESRNIYVGGKGLNQSVALARAGAQVFHAGSIGDDGLMLKEYLEEAGVDTSLVKILPDTPTGHAIIQNDAEGDNCILLFGGANQAITRQQVDEVLEGFGAGDYIVLQNEISQLPYIVEKAHEKGMKLVLNPSPMNENILRLELSYIDYFLLNEIEAGQILGISSEDKEALLAGLKEKFPGAHIVMTLGGDGSVYAYGEEEVRQGIYKVKAVDTTAAGDTFTGYFLAGLLAGKEAAEAMDLAAKAAAITVSRPGASPSIPTMAEVLA